MARLGRGTDGGTMALNVLRTCDACGVLDKDAPATNSSYPWITVKVACPQAWQGNFEYDFCPRCVQRGKFKRKFVLSLFNFGVSFKQCR